MSASDDTGASKSSSYLYLINRSVHTSDDQDIGDIFATNKHFIVVCRGFINIHFYYIPVSKVEGWDGNVLWLKITELEVKENYEKNVYPDGSRYYVKDDPPYENIPPDFPEPIIISSRSQRKRMPISEYLEKNGRNSNPQNHKCDLCEISFNSDRDLNSHMSAKHD